MALPVLTGATLCLDANTGVTADSSNRVSAWADRYALINNFTQSTNANKPLLSRADNQECFTLYSHDADNAAWSKNHSSVSSNIITAAAGAGSPRISQSYISPFPLASIPNGQQLTIKARVKYINNTYIWLGVLRVTGSIWYGANINLLTNTVHSSQNLDSSSVEVDSDGYAIITLNFTSGATSQYIEYLNIANSSVTNGSGGLVTTGTEQLEFNYFKTYRSSQSPCSTPTTTFPQYAGVNGRQSLVFNGAQALTTTSILSSLVTSTAGIIYAVVKPFILGSEHQITRGAAPAAYALRTKSSNAFYFIDSDGTARYSETPATASAGNTYILRARKSGGFIYAALDTGSGFSEGTGVACGASADLTGVYSIGASAGTALYGQLVTLQAKNTGTPETAFETELRSTLFGTAPTASTTNLFFCYPQLPIQSTVTADNPFTGFNKAEDIGAGDRAEHYRTNTERTTTNISYDLGSGVLDKPEYFIVARADYLSRGDSGTPTITLKGSVNSGYTATEDLSISVNSSTLVGLRNEDVILETSFGASYRYFRLTLSTTSSFYHEISKIYFGDFFDLERDPLYLSEFKLLKKQQDNKKHKRVYNLIYDGITEAKREAFNETILKNADIYPIYLYDKNDLFFEGKKLLHCWITDHKWDIGYFKSKLTLELTEVF